MAVPSWRRLSANARKNRGRTAYRGFLRNQPLLLLEFLERRILMSASTAPITTTTVDPSDSLRLSVGDEQPSNILGDSALGGSFSTWSFGGSSGVSTAAGVTATAQTAGVAVTLSKSGIAAMATPLEYAYYDYVQLNLQLPAGYSSDITLFYGTSTAVPTSQQGFSSTRTFTIPAAQVASDGLFHTYRINVGKLVWWEGNLTDFRVSIPTLAAGQVESLAYAEVGDAPNTTLPVSPMSELQYPGGPLDPTNTVKVLPANIQSVQSKHFIVYYDAVDAGANPGGRTNFAVVAHNELEILEQSQRLYTQVLGFRSVFGWARQFGDNTQYKLNVSTWYAGYFSGGWWFNVDTSGAQNTTVNGLSYTETPGSPIPHEFGHVTDSQNGAYLAGGHFESHANWYREQWVNWYSPKFAAEGLPTSTYVPIANMWSNLHVDNSRLIYNDFRVYTPLQYYAAAMGLDANAVSELWYQGSTNQTIFAKLATLLPAGKSIKDVAAQLMSYWPTLDFPVRADMENEVFVAQNGQTAAEIQANFFYQTTSYLLPDSDDAGYTVPLARAPESYAYMTHVLVPSPGSTSVTVTVSGLPSTDSGADWRYVLEDVSGYGTANATVNTYSPVYANGSTHTISLLSASDVVLLVVTATPANDVLDLTSFDNTARDTQSASRLTYPYQVFVTGAAPATAASERIAYPRSSSGGYHLNPDGTTGGWVDSTASVAATVYVAPGAEVLGHAVISGNVHLLDYAVVSDTAHVSGNATISGYAVVNGSAAISGNARVEDHAMVSSGGNISGNAVIEDYALVPAYIGNSVTVTDNAIVRGEATPTGNTINGTAIVDDDYTSDFSLSNGVNDNNHPYDEPWDVYYSDTQTKPDGLIASYSLNETSGSFLFDEFGALNAQLRGTPSRVSDATMGGNVLSLNGSSQYALLDHSLGELNAGTYSFWVNQTSSAANLPVLYFGSAANTFLDLTARDANGDAHLTISVNGTVQQLASTLAVPLGAWTNVTVTFTGSTATFYINGIAAGSGAMTFRPSQVLPSDAYSTPISSYLGRDASGNYFAGKLDDIRFYNVAETAAEVKNEFARGGPRLGEFFAAAPQTFNGTSTEFESGVHGGKTRTLSAWINPNSNAATYTAILDSYDERGSGNNRGTGLGLNGGIIVVRLDGVGLWSTGIAVTLNVWQQVAVTLSGTTANLYLNGVLKATHSYTAVTAAKNYHIGFYQTDDLTPTPTTTGFFSGQMYDVRIYNSVVIPTGKFDLPPAPANDNYTVSGGISSTLGLLANDTDPNPVPLSISAITQPAHGTVSIVPGATAVTYTPANGYTGSDAFTYTASDGHGGTASASVSLSVLLTLTSIVITPGAPALANGASTTFSAVAYDQLGHVMNPTPTLTWSIVSGAGTLVPSGGTNSSAGFTAGNNTELITIQAASGAVSSSAVISVTSSLAPTLAIGPTPYASSITGSTDALTVLGADPAGEENLIYTWSLVGTPPAGVNFSPNATHAAQNATAAFTQAGTYLLQVKVQNPSGHYISATTSVIVNQITSTVSVSPHAIALASDATTPFTATAYDQFGVAMAVQPPFTWSLSAGTGAVDANGLYYAPNGATTAVIQAAAAGASGTGQAGVSPEEVLWYQADASSGAVLTDSSGHNLTASLTTPYSWVAGVAGNAVKLTGGYATLPANIVSSLATATISAWVKIDTLSAWSRIFDFGTGQTVNMFLTPDNGNTNVVRFAITTGGSGGEQRIDGTSPLPTGVWTQIAVTLNGSLGTLYVNGVAVGSNAAMTLTPASLGATTQNYLGKSQYPDPAFLGSIDDFRIYNRALSAAEIQRLRVPVAVNATASQVPDTSIASLNARAEDDLSGESGITYTWATIGTPPAAVNFSLNGTNAAKDTTATFTKPGTYNFQVTLTNPAGQTSSTTTSLTVTTAVVNRYLAYLNSSFAAASDDNAIAPDKAALLPGQSAGFANYSSYSRGINGIMIDLAGPVATLSASDFTFAVGNDSNPAAWAPAPAPLSITQHALSGGLTRVEIRWNDNVIQNQWLQITLQADANSGLAAADVFYFGNLIGDSGNDPTVGHVDAIDQLVARAMATPSAAITNPADYNRDGVVDANDEAIARAHGTSFLTDLQLITASGASGATAALLVDPQPTAGDSLALADTEATLTSPAAVPAPLAPPPTIGHPPTPLPAATNPAVAAAATMTRQNAASEAQTVASPAMAFPQFTLSAGATLSFALPAPIAAPKRALKPLLVPRKSAPGVLARWHERGKPNSVAEYSPSLSIPVAKEPALPVEASITSLLCANMIGPIICRR